MNKSIDKTKLEDTHTHTHTHTHDLNTIKLFEAFAGIGAQYKALKNVSKKNNWNPISVGIIEWFVPAIIAYQAIHYNPSKIKKETFKYQYTLSTDSKKPVSNSWYNKKVLDSETGFWLNQSKEIANNYFDIRNVKGSDLAKDIDIFTYSFPCQDISNQGKQKGFQKDSQTRSGLLWEIGRILKELGKDNLPKYLLLENVKAIFDANHIKTYEEWEKELDKLGYVSKRYILNSRNFGSSQNRQRAFVISVLKTHKQKVGYEFPNFDNYIDKQPIKSILNKDVIFDNKWSKYQLNEKPLNSNNIHKYELKDYTNFNSENFVFDINYCGPTLTASGALSRIKLLFKDNKIRLMNPEECFKYMGFESKDYLKVKNTELVNENNQIYLCGNSISVEVLEALFEGMKF